MRKPLRYFDFDEPIKILSLDASTKTGWAYLENDKLIDKGLIQIDVKHLGLNGNPDKHPDYPVNFLQVSAQMCFLCSKLIEQFKPDCIVIENTVLGQNRNAQRLLEFIHYELIQMFIQEKLPFTYLNPSEWRKILEIKMNAEDKEKNKLVKKAKDEGIQIPKGRGQGKVTKKHLSVRWANETYGLALLQKDNDIADAIGLARAYFEKLRNEAYS